MAMLMPGPAAATSTMSRRGRRSRAEIDRHRLGEAEHHPAARGQQQHRRQDHRAERIDVAQRIEGDAAEPLGGVVAEPPGDEAVRRLVEGDGEQHRQDPGGDLVEQCRPSFRRSPSRRAGRRAAAPRAARSNGSAGRAHRPRAGEPAPPPPPTAASRRRRPRASRRDRRCSAGRRRSRRRAPPRPARPGCR